MSADYHLDFSLVRSPQVPRRFESSGGRAHAEDLNSLAREAITECLGIRLVDIEDETLSRHAMEGKLLDLDVLLLLPKPPAELSDCELLFSAPSSSVGVVFLRGLVSHSVLLVAEACGRRGLLMEGAVVDGAGKLRGRIRMQRATGEWLPWDPVRDVALSDGETVKGLLS